MTQTPISIAIELLKQLYPSDTATPFYKTGYLKGVLHSIETLQSLLPKEREVMQGLWDDAQTDAETKQNGFEGYKSFDDYYNATFHYQQFEKK